MGWLVAGYGPNMYTIVTKDEVDNDNANDLTVGLYGRSKRDSDGRQPRIIIYEDKRAS